MGSGLQPILPKDSENDIIVHDMITDQEQISIAISAILRKSDAALPISEDDFIRVCPDPEWAVCIIERSVGKACAMLKKEFSEDRVGNAKGIVLFIQSVILTMGDLNRIDGLLPSVDRFVRGLDFHRPSGGELEIWVFG